MKEASSAELAKMAEDGEFREVPGTAVYRREDDSPLTEDMLMDVFMGRPLAERRRPKTKSVRVVMPEPLKNGLTAAAKDEGLNLSALIRQVMGAYLEQHQSKKPHAAVA